MNKAVFFFLFFSFSLAEARVVKEFRYPIADPLRATLSVGAIKPYASPQPQIFSIRQAKSIVPEDRGAIEFGFLANKPGSPLVFMHAGLMATFRSDKDLFRAQVLHGRGYHVVILSSPIYPPDMKKLLRSGVGGHIVEDSQALYALMGQILNGLQRKGYRWKEVHQIGFSMGGIHAAFLAKIDSDKKEINFGKTILLNPPVDMGHGIRAIDKFQEAQDELGFWGTVEVLLAALGIVRNFSSDQVLFSDAWFREWNEEVEFDSTDIKAILSYHFKGNMDLINEEAAASAERWMAGNPCFIRSQGTQFIDYVKGMIVPLAYKLGRQNCRARERSSLADQVMKGFSLYSLTPFLKEAKNVFVFHNVGDFILKPSDPQYLEETFGDRAFIFLRGGHSGNIWSVQYQNLIDTVLKKAI